MREVCYKSICEKGGLTQEMKGMAAITTPAVLKLRSNTAFPGIWKPSNVCGTTKSLSNRRQIKKCGSGVTCEAQASISTNTPLIVIGNEKEKGVVPPALPFRVGHGFDLHRLEANLPLLIGGVAIPHDRGCEAHSDGDVLLHCIVDAILGALGLPDIGQIFPDTDPKWKGAPSSVFVKEAVRLMHEAGYDLGNLDATLILQRPKLSPHKEAIQANLCALLGASSFAVNIKAKTHEKVDSLGENRSIAAHTVVLLVKK